MNESDKAGPSPSVVPLLTDPAELAALINRFNDELVDDLQRRALVEIYARALVCISSERTHRGSKVSAQL